MDDASAGPAPAASRSAVPGPNGPLAGAEWPARVADTVEDIVTAVHDRGIRPLLIAARVVVFGILAGAMVLVLSVLVSIALIRVLDVYAFPRRAWASDLVVGGFVTLLGIVAFVLGRPRRTEEG